ncbi:hypothetical protein E6H23_04280 [Candidatus Bathyarchaeota archaeon]|nr:MAG: hypothetical protein E6H23_04280 [Candidatus Bathyarchaeota archaeon]
MSNFKFELWEIENGIVVTRPLVVDKDEEGNEIFKNASIYHEDPLLAVKQVQVALDAVRAQFQKKLAQKR